MLIFVCGLMMIRWSKIAQHLPGRTDNEIKNYWRTRVQKHAKQLKCDVNSKQFKDTMRYLWMPRLVERIQAASASASSSVTGTGASPAASTAGIAASSHQHYLFNQQNNGFQSSTGQFALANNDFGASQLTPPSSYTPDNSSTAASSDSFGTQLSDLTEYYSAIPVNNNPNPDNYFQAAAGGGCQVGYPESIASPAAGYFNPGLDFQAVDQINNQWMDGEDASYSLWNVDDIWLLQPQQLNTNV